VLETIFDEWVGDAEQKFLSPDYPQIDDTEIDMADELRTLAKRVVCEYLGEGSTSIPSEIEPIVEFLELRRIGSQDALPVRFVILNFLYRLAHFGGFLSETSAQELHKVVWRHFKRFVKRFVGLQEVSALQDPRTVRWEITNACAIHDWDLVRASSVRSLTALVSLVFLGTAYS
jgi:hypothetical protein